MRVVIIGESGHLEIVAIGRGRQAQHTTVLNHS